jgi:hypothetical protein
VRYFIALTILLLQLSASWAGQVSVSFSCITESKKDIGTELSSSLHRPSEAENIHPQQYNFSIRKVRDHRTSTNDVAPLSTDRIFSHSNFKERVIQSFTSGTPLSRLLLFPKHYFW